MTKRDLRWPSRLPISILAQQQSDLLYLAESSRSDHNSGSTSDSSSYLFNVNVVARVKIRPTIVSVRLILGYGEAAHSDWRILTKKLLLCTLLLWAVRTRSWWSSLLTNYSLQANIGLFSWSRLSKTTKQMLARDRHQFIRFSNFTDLPEGGHLVEVIAHRPFDCECCTQAFFSFSKCFVFCL